MKALCMAVLVLWSPVSSADWRTFVSDFYKAFFQDPNVIYEAERRAADELRWDRTYERLEDAVSFEDFDRALRNYELGEINYKEGKTSEMDRFVDFIGFDKIGKLEPWKAIKIYSLIGPDQAWKMREEWAGQDEITGREEMSYLVTGALVRIAIAASYLRSHRRVFLQRMNPANWRLTDAALGGIFGAAELYIEIISNGSIAATSHGAFLFSGLVGFVVAGGSAAFRFAREGWLGPLGRTFDHLYALARFTKRYGLGATVRDLIVRNVRETRETLQFRSEIALEVNGSSEMLRGSGCARLF